MRDVFDRRLPVGDDNEQLADEVRLGNDEHSNNKHRVLAATSHVISPDSKGLSLEEAWDGCMEGISAEEIQSHMREKYILLYTAPTL